MSPRIICRLIGHRMRLRPNWPEGYIAPKVCTRCGWDDVLDPHIEALDRERLAMLRDPDQVVSE